MWIFLALATLQLVDSPTEVPPGLSDAAQVSVVTMGPGDAAWEKFGHNMLWIRDPRHGISVAFNWGEFDFNEKNFVLHYLQGNLMYWMDAFDADRIIQAYLDDDRTIWVQQLNLSLAQRQALWDFCMWNLRDENKHYSYNYYTDNCTTRVRDAIDNVIGGQVKRSMSEVASSVTYRFETSRLIADDVPLYTALYYILGQPIDRPISAYEEMFIPMRMRDRMNQLQIKNESGQTIPLVEKEILLHTSSRSPLRDQPPQRAAWFLLVGALIGGMLVVIASIRRTKLILWFLGITAVFWSFFAGFAGWFLVYGWTMTSHVAVRPNENILQMNPLLFALIVLIPLALRGSNRAMQIARTLALIAAVGSALGLLLKILPAMYQVNANIIALALPANIGLAFAIWKIDRREKDSGTIDGAASR